MLPKKIMTLPIAWFSYLILILWNEFYFWNNLSFEIFEVRRKEFKQRREENSADSASIIEAFVKKIEQIAQQLPY